MLPKLLQGLGIVLTVLFGLWIKQTGKTELDAFNMCGIGAIVSVFLLASLLESHLRERAESDLRDERSRNDRILSEERSRNERSVSDERSRNDRSLSEERARNERALSDERDRHQRSLEIEVRREAERMQLVVEHARERGKDELNSYKRKISSIISDHMCNEIESPRANTGVLDHKRRVLKALGDDIDLDLPMAGAIFDEIENPEVNG